MTSERFIASSLSCTMVSMGVIRGYRGHKGNLGNSGNENGFYFLGPGFRV